MEYLDLSPYEYRTFPLPMRSVGWLGRKYGVQGVGASASGVTGYELELLLSASWRLSSLTLGFHECEFCREGPVFEGNGEYHYYTQAGEVYSAPMMILHYVEKHGYRPPGVFLRDLADISTLVWDWRSERLSGLLLDESEDLDIRCEAIVDLANWKDPRALEALVHAARDEELSDVAGDEIGRSLGAFLGLDFAKDIRVDSFPDLVRFGINQHLTG
ncbi:HEAT repeat domain-containing protein [Micromonospora sp. DT228]|uniref:HEAT repeat domain-containing protein n=1 Tax=Micromonospora sp. DT228 TaxID=3393443 RepID=UPI003CE85EB9